MMTDRRLSRVLHALLHMAEHEAPKTSEALAKAMSTNPVVVRRIMGGLRDEGYVRSEKGHGGGWTLACDPSKVTLRDVYAALGSPSPFTIDRRAEGSGCLVEAAVNAAIENALDEAEALLLARFGDTTLAMLGADVQRRAATRRRSRGPHKSHP